MPAKLDTKEKDIYLEDNYKPNDTEEYMCLKHLEYFKQKLSDWRKELTNELLQTLSHLKEENWNESDLNDRASLEIDVGLELKSRDRIGKLINKIDAALMKIENGSYGFCEETDEPIGLRRLEARPIATLAIAAQEKHERFEKTHNEED